MQLNLLFQVLLKPKQSVCNKKQFFCYLSGKTTTNPNSNDQKCLLMNAFSSEFFFCPTPCLHLCGILFIGWWSPMKKRLKMTMSVNDENSAGAANNNNCSKTDLDHYETQTDLGRSLWPPCPPPPPPAPQSSAAWIGGPEGPESGGPTYTPLVKVWIWLDSRKFC